MSDKVSRLLEAVSFAGRAHQGQLRKDGRTPYAAHTFRVCLIVRHVFGIEDPNVLAAALLHDTIEDTTTDCDDLIEQFGPQIAQWVRALTKDKRLPDVEREELYVRELAAGGWQVHVLKLADIFDNLIDSRHLGEAGRVKTRARIRHYLDHLAAAIDSDQGRNALAIVEKQFQTIFG